MKKRPNLFSSAIFRLLLIILAVVIPLNILTLVLSRTVLRDVERQISLENQNALDLYVSQLDYTMSRAATAMNRFVRENVEFLTLSDKNTEGSAADAQMQSIVKLRYEIRKKLEDHSGLNIYNLGTGQGYSVLDIVKNFEEATGVKIPYVIKPRRPGDIATCYADATKAKEELGWVAENGIREMCADSWNWQSHNPNGYEE